MLKTTQLAAIMGRSKSQTRLDVFKAHLYPEAVNPPDAKVIAHHKLHKQNAIDDFCFVMGLTPDECNLKMDDDYFTGEASAKFDDDGLLLLVKTPYKAKRTEITEAHHIEAQALMLLFDKPACYVSVYNAESDDTARLLISSDIAIQHDIIQHCIDFYSEADAMQEIDASDLIEQYDMLKTNIELAEQEKKDVLQKIVMICGSKETVIDGRTLKKIIRKGNVDYSKIEELKTIDLEAYRKKSSAYWMLT